MLLQCYVLYGLYINNFKRLHTILFDNFPQTNASLFFCTSDTSVHLHDGWWWSVHLLWRDPRDINVSEESKESRAAGGQQMLRQSWELHVSLCCNIRSTICMFRSIIIEYCRRYVVLGNSVSVSQINHENNVKMIFVPLSYELQILNFALSFFFIYSRRKIFVYIPDLTELLYLITWCHNCFS